MSKSYSLVFYQPASAPLDAGAENAGMENAATETPGRNQHVKR